MYRVKVKDEWKDCEVVCGDGIVRGFTKEWTEVPDGQMATSISANIAFIVEKIDEQGAPAEKPLGKMNKTELLARAAEAGLSFTDPDAVTKAQLIEMIQGAPAEATPQAEAETDPAAEEEEGGKADDDDTTG